MPDAVLNDPVDFCRRVLRADLRQLGNARIVTVIRSGSTGLAVTPHAAVEVELASRDDCVIKV